MKESFKKNLIKSYSFFYQDLIFMDVESKLMEKIMTIDEIRVNHQAPIFSRFTQDVIESELRLNLGCNK